MGSNKADVSSQSWGGKTHAVSHTGLHRGVGRAALLAGRHREGSVFLLLKLSCCPIAWIMPFSFIFKASGGLHPLSMVKDPCDDIGPTPIIHD